MCNSVFLTRSGYSGRVLKITRSATAFQYAALGAGLYAPKKFTATFEGDRWLSVRARVTIDAEWEKAEFGYRVTRLQVDEVDGGEKITSEVVREIPVTTLLRKAALRAILRGPHRTPPVFRFSIDIPEEEVQRLVSEGPKPATLRLVSHFYTVASIVGLPPVEFVIKKLGLKPRTASHWIKLARERGFLKVVALSEVTRQEEAMEFEDDVAGADLIENVGMEQVSGA